MKNYFDQVAKSIYIKINGLMENYFSIHYQFVRRRIKIKDIVVEVHVKKYTCILKYHLVMQCATNETY